MICKFNVEFLDIKGESQCCDIMFILHVVYNKYTGLFKYCLQ